MSDQFVAEIRIFPFYFAPTGWAHCDGQILPISQNTALFALLGTVYGGDGKSTFALPNLQGSAPRQPGQGAGLSEIVQGQTGGVESVTLLTTEMPLHTHSLTAINDVADSSSPAGALLAQGNYDTGTEAGAVAFYNTTSPPNAAMRPNALGVSGGGLPHNNMQPYLTLNFCIALQGIFPQRP